MATAIGAYATLANAKSRLGITDTTDDTLIQGLCDQANQFIESYTGRWLAPYPVVNTTLAAQASAGATTITVASAANVTAGNRLVIGSLNTANQEAVTIASASNTTITLSAPQGQTTAWSGLTATYASGIGVYDAQLYDGMEVLEGGRLVPLIKGYSSITQVRAGFYTGDTLKLIPTTNWFARPNGLDRDPGWPFTELWMTDIPTSDNPVPIFMSNISSRSGSFANIEIVGSPGWSAIPDDVTAVGLNLVVAMYRARGAGGADSFTIDAGGARTYTRMLSYSDRDLLDHYRIKLVGLI